MTGRVREILKYPAALLLGRSEPALMFDDELKQLALDLFETGAKVSWGKAVCLAAPQIGVRSRVFVAFNQVFVNPEVVKISPETRLQHEGCYSHKENVFTFEAYRSRWIEIKWQDLAEKVYKKRFRGWEAHIVQHALNHLDGVLCCKSAQSIN